MGLTLGAVFLMSGTWTPPVEAQAQAEVPLTIVKDRFVPAELRVKAGQPFVLVVTNKDDITHELDISQLRIEKKIRAGETLKIPMPALKTGKYELEDDDSTPELKGLLVAE
jgi:hypothetical protein